jgi:hypothetical protein
MCGFIIPTKNPEMCNIKNHPGTAPIMFEKIFGGKTFLLLT